jgi:hydroxyacylglutathione hydrolase
MRLDEVKAYKDKEIAVTCKSGVRSSKAVLLLQEAGYSRVSNLGGGMDSWEKSGLEVIRKQ